MNSHAKQLLSLASRHAPLLLLLVICLVFGMLSRTFLTLANFRSILVESASVAILAAGMTFVLLTGGIDLSVGAIMFVSAAIAGKLALGNLIPGLPPVSVAVAIAVIVPIGLAMGAINATLIARFRMMPFVVTLAAMFVGRGFALQLTETRALNLPDSFLAIGRATPLGIPFPIVLLATVLIAGHVLLQHTPFGRQLYAMGNNADAARKAGINTTRIVASVYIISGLCASLAGIVSLTQLGAVSPKLGDQREFAAIAAAVIGGTSLFGGRGTVFPGALLGALLTQTIWSGLVMVGANEYMYPMITGATIFLAVLLDRLRNLGDRHGAT